MPKILINEPFGKNSLPSDYLFVQRKYYKESPEIYPPGAPKPLDIWYERPLYGKVDTKNNLVYPFYVSLEPIPNDLLALNFVADAYEDMRYRVREAVASIRTCVSSFIDLDNPVKAYEDVNDLYHKHYTEVVGPMFINNYLTLQRRNKILDFNIFIDYFIGMVNANEGFPFTKAAFIGSRLCSNRIGGLIIEFADDSHADDNLKWEKYLSNDFFDDYVKIAAGFGFYVNKNAPWAIAANMNSRFMKQYMGAYEIPSAEMNFENNYFPAEYFSYEAFKQYIFGSYLGFRAYQPIIQKVCTSNKMNETIGSSYFETRVITKQRPRDLLEETFEEFIKMYPDSYLIEKYFQLRVGENGIAVDDRLYRKAITHIKRTLASKNSYLALEKMNEILKKLKHRGSQKTLTGKKSFIKIEGSPTKTIGGGSGGY